MLDTGKAEGAATVLAFRMRPPAERRRDARAADGIGEIVLFTGVRYERMREPEPAPPGDARDAAGPRREAEL